MSALTLASLDSTELFDDDLDLDVRELREIEKIRRYELFKTTMTREKDRLQNISNDKENVAVLKTHLLKE